MVVVNKILEFILSLMDSLLPVLNLPPQFLIKLDESITFFIDLLQKASYFVPVDVLVVCFTVMLVVDNFALLMRIGQWVIRTIRG